MQCFARKRPQQHPHRNSGQLRIDPECPGTVNTGAHVLEEAQVWWLRSTNLRPPAACFEHHLHLPEARALTRRMSPCSLQVPVESLLPNFRGSHSPALGSSFPYVTPACCDHLGRVWRGRRERHSTLGVCGKSFCSKPFQEWSPGSGGGREEAGHPAAFSPCRAGGLGKGEEESHG